LLAGMNLKHKQNQVNKKLQNFMYGMLTDTHVIAAKKSAEVMITLYHKNVWNDNKTVNVISTGLFSDVTKIKVRPLSPSDRSPGARLAPCCFFQTWLCLLLPSLLSGSSWVLAVLI